MRTPAPVDVSFPALGSVVRLLASGPGAARAVERARAEVLDYHARLSRFIPGSELSRLNADPRQAVPASPLLRSAVRAGLEAAELSCGLVDPCLLDALEAAGYGRSLQPSEDDPLLPVGPFRPARPDPLARWRTVRVDEGAGVVLRPAGLRLDLGGSGKGHAADRIARRLTRCRDWVVDAGGDVRVGGSRAVDVAHPLHAATAARLLVRDAAVATSSLVSRAWRTARGRGHHLLDPSTGLPVRTGLLSATAIAETTLAAETLAKMALLRGPAAARELLAGSGGVLVHEDGSVERIATASRVAA